MPLVETSQPNNVLANEMIIGKHMLSWIVVLFKYLNFFVANQDLQVDEQIPPQLNWPQWLWGAPEHFKHYYVENRNFFVGLVESNDLLQEP
jgi:hypothetical protein